MRKVVAVVVSCGALAVLFVSSICLSVFFEQRRLEPMFGVKSYKEFQVKYASEIVGERMIEQNGKPFLVVYLRCSRNPLWLPSGCPVIISDSDGNIVDKCSDSGDNPKFIRKWNL